MKTLLGYIVAVVLAAIVGAIILASLMTAMPGLFPILIFAGCWWAKPTPTYDLDAELAALLRETR